MSPTPERTGYSQLTREAILNNASNYLDHTIGALILLWQRGKTLGDLLTEAKIQKMRRLPVQGFIFEPLPNPVIVKRGNSETQGEAGTCLHPVFAIEGKLYATGVGHGKADLYPLDPSVSGKYVSIDWGGQAETTSYQKINEQDLLYIGLSGHRGSEKRKDIPVRTLKGRLKVGDKEINEKSGFLEFNQPVPLGELGEKLIKLASENNEVIIGISDAIQAAHGI